MQSSPIKNPNFEKPSRAKVKISKKKNFWISLKKNLVPCKLSHRGNGSNIEILAKIEGKEAKFFSKIYEGHIRI